MADVQGKLDEIVAMVEQARSRALAAHQAVVSRQELLGALEELRELLPGEMSEARQVLRDREQLIEGAKAEGRRLLAAAHEQCQRLVNDHEVLARAEQEAQDVLDYARNESSRMRLETEAYVDTLLARVQALMEGTLDTVTTGRERIRSGQERQEHGERQQYGEHQEQQHQRYAGEHQSPGGAEQVVDLTDGPDQNGQPGEQEQSEPAVRRS
jgi:vacuolar-type H+-ATPase subunit H